ncbi:uncharacterized protein N7496_007570 [Penicillium cataractarum]|uniref:Transcription factor domain-containing protein n=1 Tax=Penicillium cataractarum TaxID=2100454 RepID=A0A9W9S3P3_9EURO|nr:uncharacterized protein N7496_007570 [Penicillium cataractarum]KAJ5371478.1 hypothetical protein N7496_007570 [Penicillium cataractarum]
MHYTETHPASRSPPRPDWEIGPYAASEESETSPECRSVSFSFPSPAADVGSVQALFTYLPGTSLDPSLATLLLHGMLSVGEDLGCYGICGSLPRPISSRPLANNHSNNYQPLSELEAIVASVAELLSPALLCCILSVALELRPHVLPVSHQQKAAFDKEYLRESTLARISTLSCHYEPNLPDAFSLLLFSTTWCFTPPLIKASARWNHLASKIVVDAMNYRVSSPYSLDRHRERM